MRFPALILIMPLLAAGLSASTATSDESGEARSQPIADADHDTSAIRGEWRVISLEVDGRADSGVSFRGMRYTFDKDTWTTWAGTTTPAGQTGRPPLKAKYTIDNSEDPKHLDMILTRDKISVTKKCIYKIENDKLVICLARKGRPVSFDTKVDDCLLYTAERIAPVRDKSKP